MGQRIYNSKEIENLIRLAWAHNVKTLASFNFFYSDLPYTELGFFVWLVFFLLLNVRLNLLEVLSFSYSVDG